MFVTVVIGVINSKRKKYGNMNLLSHEFVRKYTQLSIAAMMMTCISNLVFSVGYVIFKSEMSILILDILLMANLIVMGLFVVLAIFLVLYGTSKYNY